MLKLLLKLGASSGVVTGACLADFSMPRTSTSRQGKAELEKIKSNVENITTIADIKIFEKAYGCSFGFVQSWNNKIVYTVEKFLKEEKGTNTAHGSWENNAINGVKSWKEKCKTEKSVTLFNGPNKGFAIDTTKFAK